MWFRLSCLLVLAGCAAPASAPPGDMAASRNVVTTFASNMARVDTYGSMSNWSANAGAARAAFLASCPALVRRADTSGLTRVGEWNLGCALLARPGDARAAFEAAFLPVVIGGGTGLDTGYFELILAGSRARDVKDAVPLYRVPDDLIEVDLDRFAPSLAAKRVRGRVEDHRLIPYYDRAAIEDGALAGRGLELAWVADPVEAFFLAVQGSGRVRMADGAEMRVGYAGQNGHDYTGIGKLLRERGQLAPGQATMDGIVAWLHAHQDAGRALMRENRSYVFFRELAGPGPTGTMDVTLTPGVSVAADPAFVPLGAPVFVATRTANGSLAAIMVAQDTGGAIKGPNRFDIFFGAGPDARRLAGAQSSVGRAWVLLPRAAAERLRASQ